MSKNNIFVCSKAKMMAPDDENVYDYKEITKFASTLLECVGLPKDRSVIVAETLVEADLMGHTTHGLQLLTAYLRELEEGNMTKEGEPEVVNDAGSAITWDGNYLPGPWLIHKAIDMALERVTQHPVVTVVIRKSHHIACLAAYPERVASKGMMMLLSCSDPKNRTVAPFGGITPVYSPNPIAAGIPTQNEPILFDISTSSTANGYVNRALEEGNVLPHNWLQDNTGNATNDPHKVRETPPATILPLGGLDSGHKGFALGILVEALTSALAGFGRANETERWSASVFLQIINPEAFGGRSAFLNETQYLADACKKSETPEGKPEVRLPGSRALKLRDEQKSRGVVLYPSIIPSLKEYCIKYNISFPEPLS